MESKKDIGNYFRENLENLDYSPSHKVWDGIEAELKEKKKRRFIFWLFFAVLAIGGLSTYTYFHNSNSGKPSINTVVTNNPDNSDNTNSDTKSAKSNSADKNSANSNLNNSNAANPNSANSYKTGNESVTDVGSKSVRNNLNTNSSLKRNPNSTATIGKTLKIKPNSSIVASGKNNSIKADPENSVRVASKSGNLKNNLAKKTKRNKLNTNNSTAGELANNASSTAKNKLGKHSKKGKKYKKSGSKNPKADALKFDVTTLSSSDTDKKSNTDSLKESENIAATTTEKDKNKKVSLDDLKKANQTKRDSIAAVRKAEKEKKDLAENPKEEQKDTTKTEVPKPTNELIIAPYYGVNYNGNFGNGNFLNNSSTSKKSSKFMSSYGVLVRWMGTEKLGIQLGVGIIKSTYSATFIKGHNFVNLQQIKFEVPMSEINNLFPDSTKIKTTYQTSYIELPLEAYYVLHDKKFGFATSFGISAMILEKKDLFFESDDVNRLKVGELKNLSPFCFTANVKLNLFYKISPRLQFDLYPEFQYQIMGIKDASSYNSYYFSIKTGLSYKL